jgi:hypothetical protein
MNMMSLKLKTFYTLKKKKFLVMLAGYIGADKREKIKGKFNEKVVNWNIVDGLLKELTQQIEKVKAQI